MIQVLIQVAGGSADKRFYNERTLEYKETRRGSHAYPYPYGFILGTRAMDGDCLDCYVITYASLQAGPIVECDPIGMLEQDEDGEVDHKVLATLPGETVDLDHALLEELRNFIHALFTRYPDMKVRVGNILPREVALRHIEERRENDN